MIKLIKKYKENSKNHPRIWINFMVISMCYTLLFALVSMYQMDSFKDLLSSNSNMIAMLGTVAMGFIVGSVFAMWHCNKILAKK